MLCFLELSLNYSLYNISQELIEKLNKGELPEKEFPCMNEPRPTICHGTSAASGPPAPPSSSQAAHSVRSRRTASWAKPRNSDDGLSRYLNLYK